MAPAVPRSPFLRRDDRSPKSSISATLVILPGGRTAADEGSAVHEIRAPPRRSGPRSWEPDRMLSVRASIVLPGATPVLRRSGAHEWPHRRDLLAVGLAVFALMDAIVRGKDGCRCGRVRPWRLGYPPGRRPSRPPPRANAVGRDSCHQFFDVGLATGAAFGAPTPVCLAHLSRRRRESAALPRERTRSHGEGRGGGRVRGVGREKKKEWIALVAGASHHVVGFAGQDVGQIILGLSPIVDQHAVFVQSVVKLS